MSSVILLFFGMLASNCDFQQNTAQANTTSMASHESLSEPGAPIDHSSWDMLLKRHVDIHGNVDYKNFHKDKQPLTDYLEYLAQHVPDPISGKNELLAYYINLYNAGTVKLILDNYPTKSIKDINSPWSRKWIKVGDQMLSLGHIEHKILRKMNEPRIHFAINCASFSCPKLLNIAFTSANTQALLEQASKDFINDPTRNKITKDRLELSNIFKWYKKDFRVGGSLRTYIDQFSTVNVAPNAKIKYLKYDWSLNEKK
ncbi:MAG: DUF547 domain-containing protein [Flavobacteriaceae bacterium]